MHCSCKTAPLRLTKKKCGTALQSTDGSWRLTASPEGRPKLHGIGLEEGLYGKGKKLLERVLDPSPRGCRWVTPSRPPRTRSLPSLTLQKYRPPMPRVPISHADGNHGVGALQSHALSLSPTYRGCIPRMY